MSLQVRFMLRTRVGIRLIYNQVVLESVLVVS